MCKGGNGGPQPLEGKQLDLPMGSVSGPGGVQEQELGAPPPWPQFPTVAPPSVDGGYAGHLASRLAAPQHGGASQIHQGNPERKRERT